MRKRTFHEAYTETLYDITTLNFSIHRADKKAENN